MVLPHRCLFHWLLGIPCPGCGILRGLFALVSGNYHAALSFNPAAPCFLAATLVQVPLRALVLCGTVAGSFAQSVSKCLDVAVISVALVAWVCRLAS